MRSLPTHRTAYAAALTALAAALALGACTGSSGGSRTTPPPTPSSTTPSTSHSATHPPAKPRHRAVNPLRGKGPVPKSPVIAVKIDDTASGRPQLGIDKADVVYVEAVEGGLTRLAAIFGTFKPTVGYVRSTRPSDPDLLLQYGKITEAYSGGAHDSLPRVHRSGITSWSNDDGKPYYSRRPHANDHGYINLVLNLRAVANHVKTPRPKSIGWTFATHTPLLKHARKGTDVRTVVTGSYSHGTPVEFRWNKGSHRYVRYINGQRQVAADGKSVSMRNVIVQSCKVVAHPQDSDVLGNPSQFTYTVGKGKVSVFRNGKRIDGYWSRNKLKHGTLLRTKQGKRIPLMPGNTWVVLIRKGINVSG